MKQIATIMLVVLAFGVAHVRSEESSLVDVPFFKLVSDLDEFDGDSVVVCGFLRYRHHEKALFLSRDEAEYGFVRNAIWLYAQPGTTVISHRMKGADLYDLDGRYVEVTGTIDSSKTGGGSVFVAGVVDVVKVRELKRSK